MLPLDGVLGNKRRGTRLAEHASRAAWQVADPEHVGLTGKLVEQRLTLSRQINGGRLAQCISNTPQ